MNLSNRTFRFHRLACCLAVLAFLVAAPALLAQLNPGQDLRDLENQALDLVQGTDKPASEKSPASGDEPDAILLQPNTSVEAAETAGDNGADGEFLTLRFDDPASLLSKKFPGRDLSLEQFFRSRLEGRRVTNKEILTTAKTVEKILQETYGYFIADVSPDPIVEDGKEYLQITVRDGKFGQFRFNANVANGEEEKPFAQRFYSTNQILRALAKHIEPGDSFNYLRFRSALQDINSSPSLTLGATIVDAEEQLDDVEVADVNFEVEESLPLYLAFELNNTGRLETEYYRGIASAQYANLWKRDHVLTLSAPLGIPDGEGASKDAKLYSGAFGYSLPWTLGAREGGLSLFGGYSTIEIEEIAVDEPIGLEGDGYFGGVRGFVRTYEDEDRLMNVTLGLNYRNSDDSFVVRGQQGSDSASRPVDLVPAALGFVYADKDENLFGGRSFLTLLSIFNLGDMLGQTDIEGLNSQREGAEPDYFIQKAQASYLRPFTLPNSDYYWFVYGRLDMQYSPNGLIPAEQFSVGGVSSVRGYPNRDVVGDYGAAASLELRTPVYDGFFRNSETAAQDKVQFVPIFLDVGSLSNNKLDDEADSDSQSLLSLGAGLRYSLFKNFQMKLDYGFPLKDTGTSAYVRQEDSEVWFQPGGGRLHFSLQFQHTF